MYFRFSRFDDRPILSVSAQRLLSTKKSAEKGGRVTRIGFHNKGWCEDGVICRLR